MVSTPRRVSHAARVGTPLQEAQHALIVRMGEQRAATRRISFVSDVKLDFGLPLVITSARNAKQVVIKTRNWSQNVKLARKELTTKSEVPRVIHSARSVQREDTHQRWVSRTLLIVTIVPLERRTRTRAPRAARPA